MRVASIRPPVAAIGWPMEQPLPLTLTLPGSMSRIRTQATHMDANASLISKRVTSPTDRPARLSAFGIACTGADHVSLGSTPTDAQERTIASGALPSSAAIASLATTSAAAPPLEPQALPAVTALPPPALGGFRAPPSPRAAPRGGVRGGRYPGLPGGAVGGPRRAPRRTGGRGGGG